MKWIGVQNLPLSESEADVPWVIYEKENLSGIEPNEKFDISSRDKWTGGTIK